MPRDGDGQDLEQDGQKDFQASFLNAQLQRHGNQNQRDTKGHGFAHGVGATEQVGQPDQANAGDQNPDGSGQQKDRRQNGAPLFKHPRPFVCLPVRPGLPHRVDKPDSFFPDRIPAPLC